MIILPTCGSAGELRLSVVLYLLQERSFFVNKKIKSKRVEKNHRTGDPGWDREFQSGTGEKEEGGSPIEQFAGYADSTGEQAAEKKDDLFRLFRISKAAEKEDGSFRAPSRGRRGQAAEKA